MKETVDLSKIPSVCSITLCSNDEGYYCMLEEKVRGKRIRAAGVGKTPQEAVDAAVESFTS